MDDVRTIEQVCQDCLDHADLLSACNRFVQAVCGAKGYPALFVKGEKSDSMFKKLTMPPFHSTSRDGATDWASKGKLVLAGLDIVGMTFMDKQGTKHVPSMAHVVIVAPGGPSVRSKIKLANGKIQDIRGGYPLCYGGAAIPAYRIKAKLSVDIVFPGPVLDKVVYAYLDVPSSK